MNKYKLHQPHFLFACLMTLSSLSSCSPSSKSLPVYLSTPLSGSKDKGKRLLNAAELYISDHPEKKLELHTLDSKSNDKLSAEQMMSFIKEKNPKLVFGPPGSAGANEFLKISTGLTPEEKKNFFFLNQVTASPKMNLAFSGINTFFQTEDYLSGVVNFLLTKEKKPRKVHIIHLKNVAYLDEVAEFARRDLRAKSIPIGLDISILENGASSLFEEWKKADIKKEDWVFLITHNIPDTFLPLKDDKLFSETIKIFTYGRANSYMRKFPWLYQNSWQALFWHSDLEYQNSGSLSNCAFEAKYEQKFKSKPDFHSAYMYSTFEAVSALNFTNPFLKEEGLVGIPPIPTLTGEVQWDQKGLRLSLKPILFHQGSSGDEIYLPSTVKKLCDNPRYLTNVSVKSWDNISTTQDMSVWKQSIKGKTRFIPVELWDGSNWNGSQILSMKPGEDKKFSHTNSRGHTYTKELLSPLEWFHPKINQSFLVYKRISPKTPKIEAKTQLFTLTEDTKGIGRVFDTREGNYYAFSEVKFPLGQWTQGEEKIFRHLRWYQGDKKPREFTTTIKILEIDYTYKNVPHSLKYELTIHDENHKMITHNIYVYSPNQANVLTQNLLNQYR